MLAGSRIKVILSQGGNERAKLVQYLFQQRRLSRLRIVAAAERLHTIERKEIQHAA